MADISTEIAEIEAASSGNDVRQSIIDALTTLNGGILPDVSASDAGKFLVVNDSGTWEVDQNGIMRIPTVSLSITENGTYDVTNYASVIVNIT